MATGTVISAVFCAVALIRFCAAVLPVDPRGRGRAVRQPVQREVVEHVVLRRRLLGILAVRPVREPGVHEHPAGEAGRGVRQAVADGLRARAHHRHVGQIAVLAVASARRRTTARSCVERVAAAWARRRAPRRPRPAPPPAGWCGCRAGPPAPAAPSPRRCPRPSRRPGRRSACSRAASSARPRHGRCARDPSPAPSGVPRSRSPAATGSRRRRRPRPGRRTRSGSVSGPMSLICSNTEPGQPWVMISGSAFGWRRADVDEVDVDAVDGRHELRQGVQLRFGLAPVVAAAPVAHELLELRELRALRASATVSLSGQRVAAIRRRRSVRSPLPARRPGTGGWRSRRGRSRPPTPEGT